MSERHLRPIDDPSEIPENLSDEERVAFLEAHGVSEEFLVNAEEVPEEERPRPRTKAVNVRFDDFTLSRLKGLADHRGVGYQTLLKQFVTERLYEEERRTGTLPVYQADEAATQENSGAEVPQEPVASTPAESSKPVLSDDIESKARRFLEENEPLLEEGSATVLGRVFVTGAKIIGPLSEWAVEATNKAERVVRTLTAAINDTSTPPRRLRDLERERTRALKLHEHRAKVFREFAEFMDRVSSEREQRPDEDDADDAVVQEAEKIVREAAARVRVA